MTSLAEAGPRSARRGMLVWIALAVSLTLNVCVIGGVLWSMVIMHPETPAQRFLHFGRQLDLSGDQTKAFEEFGRTVRERDRALHEANGPLLEQVWSEWAKPTADQAVISRLVEQATENRLAYQKDVAAALTTFLASLTPEQRSRFSELARRRSDQISRRLWMMIAP